MIEPGRAVDGNGRLSEFVAVPGPVAPESMQAQTDGSYLARYGQGERVTTS